MRITSIEFGLSKQTPTRLPSGLQLSLACQTCSEKRKILLNVAANMSVHVTSIYGAYSSVL